MTDKIIKEFLLKLNLPVTSETISSLKSSFDLVPVRLKRAEEVETSLGIIAYHVLSLLLSAPSDMRLVKPFDLLPLRVEESELRFALGAFWISVQSFRSHVFGRLFREGGYSSDDDLITEQILTAEGRGWIEKKREEISVTKWRVIRPGAKKLVTVSEMKLRYFLVSPPPTAVDLRRLLSSECPKGKIRQVVEAIENNESLHARGFSKRFGASLAKLKGEVKGWKDKELSNAVLEKLKRIH